MELDSHNVLQVGLGTYTLTFRAENSDGNVAEAFAAYQVVTLLDFDGDGDGYSPNGGDCNDSNQEIYPGAEICDGLDNDCSELTPAKSIRNAMTMMGMAVADSTVYQYDVSRARLQRQCSSRLPQCAGNLNNIDDNCDGRVDEGTVVYDDDGDGYCKPP